MPTLRELRIYFSDAFLHKKYEFSFPESKILGCVFFSSELLVHSLYLFFLHQEKWKMTTAKAFRQRKMSSTLTYEKEYYGIV